MAITDQLLQIANAARVVPLGTAAPSLGVPISFGLTPAFPVSLDTVLAGDFSALWFTKDVRFADALAAPAGTNLSTYLTDASRVIGGQPVVDPGLSANLPLPGGLGGVLSLPKLTNTVTNPPTPPANDLAAGIPGVLCGLTGAVPIPIQVPVSVEVTWTVTKSGGPATPGTDFVAPQGLTGPTLDLVFLATSAAELKDGFSPLVRFEIRAQVTVKALGQTAGPVTTPSIPLDVPALLGIPTVLALFKHSNYAHEEGEKLGAVLLAVPNNALLKSVNDLAPVLGTLRETITRLQSFKAEATSSFDFAAFLLGLGTLIDALNSQPKFQFVVGNQNHLDNVVFAESSWRLFPPRLNGQEKANNMTSSVILIGVKGSSVKLWGDPGFHIDGDGTDDFSLKLSVGVGMWASISNFNGPHEVSEMVVVPPLAAGTGVTLDPSRYEGNLDNAISSVEFL